jgi:hypothetical protein
MIQEAERLEWQARREAEDRAERDRRDREAREFQERQVQRAERHENRSLLVAILAVIVAVVGPILANLLTGPPSVTVVNQQPPQNAPPQPVK